MASEAIKRLRSELRNEYGAAAVSPYGTSDEKEHGTAFTIAGIPATFSVHTREGALPDGHYDIQIEGSPPGDYLYANAVTLDEFLRLILRFSEPQDQWPTH